MMVLAVHGTRDPAGVRVAESIARQVREAGVPVRVGYADVRQPSVADVVQPGCVVVPAFLAAGYHVRTDLPAQLAGSGAILTPHLGTSLIPAAHDRLLAAGYRPGDTLVLAAAGSSDDRALAEVRRAADLLAQRCGHPVAVGYVAGTAPKLAEVVAHAREPGRRIAVATWLLAPGLFHARVQQAGSDLVAEPIGAHPALVGEVLARYRAAQVRSRGVCCRASRGRPGRPAT